MKWPLKREVFPFTILFIMVCVTIYYNSILPDKMPIHFDASGNINRWTEKNMFFIINYALVVALYFIITFIPFIDPLWKKIESKYRLMLLFRDVAIGFIAFIFGLCILSAIEGTIRKDLLGIGLGLLFFLLGNYMPKLPRNWFFGIRTPWTLSSEVIWKKTHIVGGLLFAMSGLAIIVLSLLKVSLIIVVYTIIIPISLVSCLFYPLYLFKKMQKTGEL